MQVEHVARVRLAARRAPQQQRELPVRRRMLRQVIVDDQRVPARVAEILAHRHAGVGGEVLQRGRVTGRGGNDDAVRHGPGLFEYLDDARHRRALLADGDVDADDVLALLVDDGVHRDGGLAGLPVAGDQPPLATPDGDHRVDGLDPGLQGLAHGLALDHPGRPDLDPAELLGRDRPLAVQRGADRVHDPPDDGLSDGDFRNPARPLDQIPLLDMLVGAQDHRTDVVLFQVERDPLEAAGELQQLPGHRPVQPVDLGDAVPDLEHGADSATSTCFSKDFTCSRMIELISSALICMRAAPWAMACGYVRVRMARRRSSCPRTVPSYTQLPKRISSPLISPGSTWTAKSTWPRVTCSSRVRIAARSLSESGRAATTWTALRLEAWSASWLKASLISRMKTMRFLRTRWARNRLVIGGHPAFAAT